MLLLFTHQASDRVRYTFRLIFKSVLGIDFELTVDPHKFRAYQGAKLSYAHEPVSDELHFPAGKLLFEKGIRQLTSLPADPFERAFFLAARYEEYLPFPADHFGRFSAKQSLSCREGILSSPVTDRFAMNVAGMISGRYPAFPFPEKKYSFLPTLDIDNAYAYRGKSLLRTMGGYARALARLDRDDLVKRKNVLSGKEKDPYDTYELQAWIHKKYNLQPLYFFLLGDWAPNDKNLPYTHPLMQALIKDISSSAPIGIHPSFASNADPKKINTEKARLEKIKKTPVSGSRQHFLMLKFPDTYRNLLAAGITNDYTMGYADDTGFRAGTCSPYKWYDLLKEEETGLTIHPFGIMDGTLNSYLQLSPEQALDKVKQIVREVKSVNGRLITIWHNETLSGWRKWKGWENVYENVLSLAAA